MPKPPAPDGVYLELRGRTYYARGKIREFPIRESLGTTDPARAEILRKELEAATWARILNPPPPPETSRPAEKTFADAVEVYLGRFTKTEIPTQTARFTDKLLGHFGETPLSQIGQDEHNAAVEALIGDKSASYQKRAVTTPLKAILRCAAMKRMCALPVITAPPQQPRDIKPFLNPDEAKRLCDEAAEHLKPLLCFLFATGVRPAEALELPWRRVDLKGATAVVDLKSNRITGRRRRHTVHLNPASISALTSIKGDREGFVFKPAKGKVVGKAYADYDRSSGGQFRTGWNGACQRAGLPGRVRQWTDKYGKSQEMWVPEVTPYVTRHSWATWHYCVWRDMQKLVLDGGWEDAREPARYAKRMGIAYRPEILAFWGISEAEAKAAA